jgi:hypothetical protein
MTGPVTYGPNGTEATYGGGRPQSITVVTTKVIYLAIQPTFFVPTGTH